MALDLTLAAEPTLTVFQNGKLVAMPGQEVTAPNAAPAPVPSSGSNSPTQPPVNKASSSNGLSTGAIAGIAAGSACVLIIAIIAAVVHVRRGNSTTYAVSANPTFGTVANLSVGGEPMKGAVETEADPLADRI
jgi:hypothetical protein